MSARIDSDRRSPRRRVSLRLSVEAGERLDQLATASQLSYRELIEALLMGDFDHRSARLLGTGSHAANPAGLSPCELQYLNERSNYGREPGR